MEKITKYFTTKAQKKEDRVLRFIGSDQKTDRDGDQIMVDGWNLTEYKKNPVVLFSHNYGEPPVAKTKKVWVDKNNKTLMFDIEFPGPDVSSVGDSLFKLYDSGFMSATSVGFKPDFDKIKYPEKTKGPSRIFEGQTLLEISLVSVGANARALLTSKSVNDAVESKIIDQLELAELLTYFENNSKEKETKEEMVCQLIDPKGFDKFVRKNGVETYNNKDIDIIYTNDKIQGYRYKQSIWTEKEAKEHCLLCEGTFVSDEEKAIKNPSEPLTEDSNDKAIVEHKKELDTAETKIAELELKLYEKEIDEEIEENDLYSKLFDEFVAEPKKQEEKLLDELLEDLR